MLKRLFFPALLILALALPAWADADSHRKACEELMTLLEMDKMVAPMSAQINRMQEEMLAKMDVPPDMVDITKDHMKRVDELVRREMGWENMKKDFVDVYVSLFTEQEIRDTIRFYESPTGRKYIEKSPEMMAKIMESSQNRFMKIMPELEKLSNRLTQEIADREKSKK